MEMPDWQAGKTLHERMLYMLNKQIMCDVTFKVGSKETEIKAHKFMLASVSPVFYNMFDGPLAEKGDISIPDIEEDVFKEILRFVYTDIVEVNEANVKGLLYAAEKYMLATVKTECSSFLNSLIDEDHACVVLQTSHDFNLDQLKLESLQFIYKHGKSCLESDMFLFLSAECLELVIDSNNLKCREYLIFEKVVQWGKNKCKERKIAETDANIRKIIGNLLYKIRFPTMERKYFTDKVSTRHILSPSEIINIYQSYMMEEQ